jgi:hypothetical protein
MEINLGDERIVELLSVYSPEQVREKALAKRADVFGQVVKLIQRPNPEDIEIAALQRRLEPFWYAAASARYVYDRRHTYSIEVLPEVQSVTVYGNQHAVAGERKSAFQLEAVEHCVEESRHELILDAVKGQEAPLGKYLDYPQHAVPDMAALEQDGTLVVSPEVRGSFVVRKLAALLMKTFQADKIIEEKIDVEQVMLAYRPVYAIEYVWKSKQKKQVMEFDALIGEFKAVSGEIKKRVVRVLENDALFDIGADVVGTVLPGGNVVVKLGRLAARKVVR